MMSGVTCSQLFPNACTLLGMSCDVLLWRETHQPGPHSFIPWDKKGTKQA